MLPLNLTDVTPEHIADLISSEVAEGLTLEYKQELPNDSTDQKREFVYDIAAMANAGGGDIVYGITDRRSEDNKTTGIAGKLAGLKLPNAQTEITRLTNLIRDSIAPRLVGVTMQHVVCPDGAVLVIRIPKSWNRPHMVTFGGVNKFFGRTTTGKYPMSVGEIGRVFSEQSELTDRIAQWRSHRAGITSRNAGPIPVHGPVTMLFHVIPASAFSKDVLRQSWTIPDEEKHNIHVSHGYGTPRYNADGFLTITNGGVGSAAYGYTQLFRSGIAEYAESYCYYPRDGMDAMIAGPYLEQEMIDCYQDAIIRFRKQGRTEPLYVGFSLIGIRQKSFYFSVMQAALLPPIEQDIFTSPEVFVDINEPEERPYRKTLLPLVDTMWQVAGREGTPFKSNGVWEPFKEWR